ncbi:MAG: glycosyltransferase [Xanthomonadaceae bacterium]|nr:glycosyltransferase [Xanthomonadaceae bacterium]
MKVWLLLSRLDHGGLERVQLNLAKALHAHGIDISLVAGQVLADTHKELPRGTSVLEVAKSGAAYFPAGLLRALCRDRPDFVFTTSNDVACLMVLFRLLLFRRTRVIVAQHLSLSGPMEGARGFTRLKLVLTLRAMRALVPRADGVVAVSRGVAEEILQKLGVSKDRLQVIYNPIVTPEFDVRTRDNVSWPWSDHDVKTIIYVGRLSAVKRLDLLLESFEAALRKRPIRLLIAGEGPLQNSLEVLIAEKGLQDHIWLTGFVSNPLPLMCKAAVLVLPSDYEGFGNVLVEAMACGTQVIATNCPHGPAEILAGGKFGQLVPVDRFQDNSEGSTG